MKEKSVQVGRRAFIRFMALVGGAGGLFRADAAEPGVSTDFEPAGGRDSAGYRETEHIRKYYSKARC